MRDTAIRRVGELMAEDRAADKLAKAGNPNWVSEKPNSPTLAEQGIDKKGIKVGMTAFG